MSNSTLPPLTGTSGGMVRSKTSEKKTAESKKMEITIHVCDETKNLKKDFTCPRNLLLNEMKYFQDNLSSDTEAWEDIDISVHCDVKIFDWLIRYVKRDSENKTSRLLLDNKTAVSILISSEFLKMENLVEECINFCHNHLSEIIASPCNMNCINDSLVKKIAASFTQHDLELVIDKKDKFKSKLFCKKIEELFDPSYSSKYSLNNASCLYKCLHCGKLLLPSMEGSIECIVSRTIIDRFGCLQYVHCRDSSWDVTEYLLNTKQQMKSWRAVFWRLWATVNYLQCFDCEKIFPLFEYNKCRHHPKKATVQNNPDSGNEVLVYPCCGNCAMLFEPITCNTGCKYKYHEVDAHAQENSNDQVCNSSYVFNTLLSVLDFVCDQETPSSDSSNYTFESMLKTELSRLNKCVSLISKEEKRDKKRPSSQKTPNYNGKSSQTFHKSMRSKATASMEEDSDIDEPGIVRIVIQHKDTPSLNKNLAKTWNNDLPVRLNQDVQRESDVKRMNDLLRELTLTQKNSSAQHQDGYEGKPEVTDGGLYHRIENKLKASLATQNHSVSNTKSSINTHSKHSKNR